MKREEIDFGEDLFGRGRITRQQLDQAFELSRDRKQELRRSLFDLRILSEDEYDQCRAEFYGIPYICLETFPPDPEVLGLVTEDFARNDVVFPLFLAGASIAIAISDPTNLITIDQLRVDTQHEIDLYYAPAEQIIRAIDRHYDPPSALTIDTRPISGTSAHEVPRIVDSVLRQAMRSGASDIHIEPGPENVMVRQRVDGVLHETQSFPGDLQANIISRIKVMANLDIAETRVPQDGQIQQTLSGEEVSLRVSTLPTTHGENVVIRLLVSSKARIGLGSLGFSNECLGRFQALVRRPYGMIVVTGPTGSGKTTTLYAALDLLNTVQKNIMTIEDPVEYTIDLLRQIQVSHKAGLTFGAGLRAILRQDPDVIMVGEIRDVETASVAMEAALTGHLVLSTLHTNTAAGAVARLINMKVPPYLIASGLVGVLAQRLVRLSCDFCKAPYEPPPRLRQFIPDPEMERLRPEGCDHCRGSGYRGRLGIYELLEVNPEMQAAILDSAPTLTYERLARDNGMVPMFHDGLRKIRRGLTTLDEILAVCEERPVESPAEETPA